MGPILSHGVPDRLIHTATDQVSSSLFQRQEYVRTLDLHKEDPARGRGLNIEHEDGSLLHD